MLTNALFMMNHSYDRFKEILFVSLRSTLADCNSVAWQMWSVQRQTQWMWGSDSENEQKKMKKKQNKVSKRGYSV